MSVRFAQYFRPSSIRCGVCLFSTQRRIHDLRKVFTRRTAAEVSSRRCTVTKESQSLTYVASSFGALDTCAVTTVAGCRDTRAVSNSIDVKSLLLSIRTDAPEPTTNALSSILGAGSGWPSGQTVQLGSRCD